MVSREVARTELRNIASRALLEKSMIVTSAQWTVIGQRVTAVGEVLWLVQLL